MVLSILVFRFNYAISEQISCFFSNGPNLVLMLLTELGNGLFAIILIFGLRKNVPQRLLTYFLLSLTVQLLKHNFDLPRPASFISHTCITGQVYLNHSFPSGHAATAFFLAYLLLEAKAARYLSMVFFLSAFSRVFVGAHFLVDVTVSGFLASIFYLTLSHFNFKKNGYYPFWLSTLSIFLILHPGPELESQSYRILGASLLVFFSFNRDPDIRPNRFQPVFLIIAAVAISPQFRNWGSYLMHLGKHQASSIFLTSSIEEALCKDKLSTDQKTKLRILNDIRPILEQKLGLGNSQSFRKVKYIDREQLGYQLTFAQEFNMELEQFYFPLIGKFSYLGFFNRDIALDWRSRFQHENYDVHISLIGAYSTLGILPDPIFSTYLNLDKHRFTSLVSHELVHEAFYISDDTYFSERLASFLENKLIQTENPNKPVIESDLLTDWNYWLDQLIADLETIYSSSKSQHLLRIRKSFFLRQKKKEILILSKNKFSKLKIARSLAFSNNLWNNASLLQMKLYQIDSKGLETLWKHTKGDPALFMRNIKRTSKCSHTERRQLIKEEKLENLYKLSCFESLSQQ